MLQTKTPIHIDAAREGYRLMAMAKAMTDLYEANFKLVSKYVHATSRGHEAIQLAVGMQLIPRDYAFPYYRDEAMLLGMGFEPYELMLQLLARRDDPFSGGRAYYAHPAARQPDRPKIPHQSSATGMQAIPAAGLALGLQYLEQQGLAENGEPPVCVCSMGDASITEGEVAEALQMAALRRLPILFLIQDNGWDISASAEEVRAQDAVDYARGFEGLEGVRLDGTDFAACYEEVARLLRRIREERCPILVQADVPLLNHHTSGVRKEWYRDDLDAHARRDPLPRLRHYLLDAGVDEEALDAIEQAAEEQVKADFDRALQAEEPQPEDLFLHDFAPTPIRLESGQRKPGKGEKVVMVDAALHAVEEIMRDHPEALLYGQDVGRRLGGVFREAATLADKFGDERVFNTPIQEAFIIGSTVGMSAVGLKPIVEVQFADYLWPGLNQLFTEVSRSCYLTAGKWPVSCVIRVPTGAYGGGGPYHSSSLESVVTNIRGIKVAYPSNGADLKGLLKAAFHDPNPVLIFEHKGLYWSKVKGTERASTIEPDKDYILPLGQADLPLKAEPAQVDHGNALLVVTYGMGVHWAHAAAGAFPGRISILDLRTLFPLDETLLFTQSQRHGRILVVTEEPVQNSFAQALAGRIQEQCFQYLDAPVRTLGAENLPAIPLNLTLETHMLPSAEKVQEAMEALLAF